MTQINQTQLEKNESQLTIKDKLIKYIKFFLIPGWRDPDFKAIETEIGKIKSQRRFFRRLLTPLTIVGFIMIFFISILAIYSPWLTTYTLTEITPPNYPSATPPFQLPSPEHPLGTTQYGYDLLARLIWGARTTMQIAAYPVAIAIGGGVVIGTISAYLGGWLDSIIMRICDVMYSIPTLIIVIIIAPLIGRDLLVTLTVYGLLYIPTNIRFMRSLVLQAKQNAYVMAALTSGANKFRVMFNQILPNVISPIIINFAGAMGFTILALAGLSFIGLGDPTIADWGTDINSARSVLIINPGASLWPGLFIGIAAIGFVLLGDGLRDGLDPRLHI